MSRGARNGVSCLFVTAAEAYWKLGQIEDGLIKLDQAQSVANDRGERWVEAEIHRLRGDFLLMLDTDETEVEACFRQAIKVSRRQEAKSWELRATVSLCRLLQQQGRREEGRQMLSDIYGWFTEGLNTPDLIDARQLLDELSNTCD